MKTWAVVVQGAQEARIFLRHQILVFGPSLLITWSLLEDVYFLFPLGRKNRWRWKNEKGTFLKWGSADGWTIGAEGTCDQHHGTPACI